MKYSSVFEAIRDKASGRLNWEAANCGDGIDATIEALKEMMVGEPKTRCLIHTAGGTYFAEIPKAELGARMIEGVFDRKKHHGTDGEEVTVMVFRLQKP